MTIQEQRDYWLKFNRFQQRYESIYTPKINNALKAQNKQYIDNGTLMAVNSLPIVEVLLDLYKTIAPIWGASSIVDLASRKARMPMGFSQRITDLMLQYYSIEIWNLADNITDTTKALIQHVLDLSVVEGFGFDEIIRRLALAGITANRARLIARTETVGAANYAASIVARETGLVMDKIWIAAIDMRTRDHHIEINQTVVPMDAKFPIGPYGMDYPGDKDGGPAEVCNCRCTHAYIPKRDANGQPISVGRI